MRFYPILCQYFSYLSSLCFSFHISITIQMKLNVSEIAEIKPKTTSRETIFVKYFFQFSEYNGIGNDDYLYFLQFNNRKLREFVRKSHRYRERRRFLLPLSSIPSYSDRLRFSRRGTYTAKLKTIIISLIWSKLYQFSAQ